MPPSAAYTAGPTSTSSTTRRMSSATSTTCSTSRAGPARNAADRLRLLVEKLNLGKFVRLLSEEPWDLVINTHFLPAEIIAHLRKKGRASSAASDGDHRLRDSPALGQPALRPLLHRHGRGGPVPATTGACPLEHISVTGIPIHPVFSKPKDRAELLAKHRLAGDRPVLLQLAGGFGVGPIEKIYRAILDVDRPLELVGRHRPQRGGQAGLEKIAVPPTASRSRSSASPIEIDELMAVADLVVTKPGGLTTSETLAPAARAW